jgi:phage-related protein
MGKWMNMGHIHLMNVGIQNGCSLVVNGIKYACSLVVNGIKNGCSLVVNGIKYACSLVVNGIKNGCSLVVNGIEKVAVWLQMKYHQYLGSYFLGNNLNFRHSLDALN